jgi:hypothetical protein
MGPSERDSETIDAGGMGGRAASVASVEGIERWLVEARAQADRPDLETAVSTYERVLASVVASPKPEAELYRGSALLGRAWMLGELGRHPEAVADADEV